MTIKSIKEYFWPSNMDRDDKKAALLVYGMVFLGIVGQLGFWGFILYCLGRLAGVFS